MEGPPSPLILASGIPISFRHSLATACTQTADAPITPSALNVSLRYGPEEAEAVKSDGKLRWLETSCGVVKQIPEESQPAWRVDGTVTYNCAEVDRYASTQ